MTSEVHGNGVSGKEGEIELSEAEVTVGGVEWGPPESGIGGEDGLDDAGGFARGMEGGVGGEGEQEDEDLVEMAVALGGFGGGFHGCSSLADLR